MTALQELLTFPRFGPHGVNERMEQLTQGLEMVPTIKVVGSNGKGTCAHMMAAMAQNLGKKVGLYTSPHILKIGERIRINGREIADRDLNYILKWAIDHAKKVPDCGRFEILTLAALYHFAQSDVDIAIMEIGLGGRFDPVRIAPGHISVLTSIDLEHTQILGDTVEEIAREKAAVCKEGETLICGVSGIENCLPDGVNYLEITHPPLEPLQNNARLSAHAIQAFYQLGHLPEMDRVPIMGRLHKVGRNPDIFVDVAHTKAAIEHLIGLFSKRPITLICALKNDKDISRLNITCDHVISLQFSEDMKYPQDIEKHVNAAQKNRAASITEALDIAQENIANNGVILCIGGFEIVGRTLAHLNGLHYDVISL